MRDTWNGSGINSVDMTREFTCRDCDWEGELDGMTDDSQFMLYAICPNCKEELSIDLGAEREHEKYFGDRD
jgi:Zn finger protein HypA/HybF involved in hydrogenase expression